MNKAVKTVNGDKITLKIYGGFISEHTLLQEINYQEAHAYSLEKEYLTKYQAEIVDVNKIYTFEEAFEEFIVGQTITCSYATKIEYQYPEGVELSNGYKLLFYGGGASGNDYNDCFILDQNNILIAKKEN